MSKDFEFFGEEDFLDKMNNVVLPFFRINMLEGEFKSFDGRSIHYYYLRNPEEKAAIVISHGFCEFNGKYHEMMYYFYIFETMFFHLSQSSLPEASSSSLELSISSIRIVVYLMTFAN